MPRASLAASVGGARSLVAVAAWWRRRALLAGGVVAVAVAVGWVVSPAWSQDDEPPLPTFAFLARADNPVDALAAGALAGQLGGPVLVTGTDALDAQAAQGLVDADPQVVVLAGGTAALSEQVEADVAALLPDAVIRRAAGAGRTETARLLNTLPAELGVGRPVVTGAPIAGDVTLEGTLRVGGQDVGAALQALADRVAALEAGRTAADERIAALEAEVAAADERADALEVRVAAAEGRVGALEAEVGAVGGRAARLESDLAAAAGRVAALEATLAGVSRDGDVLTFSGMNVRIVNGQGVTASTNGLGNLIVGYGEDHSTRECQPSASDCQYVSDGAMDTRTGSHMVVVGVDHSYTGYGGVVAGFDNTTSGVFASVTGGSLNSASGRFASVAGGRRNGASGELATVTGGDVGVASGYAASVSGGGFNRAAGYATSVTGGTRNVAEATASTVAGGSDGVIAGAPTSNDYDSRIGDTVFPDG